MKTIFLLVALLCAPLLAAAQNLVISWTPNPVAESNQLYRVYISTNGGPVGLAAFTAGTTVTLSGVPFGSYAISMTASNVWRETAQSVPVTVVVSPVLAAPVAVTAAIRSGVNGPGPELVAGWGSVAGAQVYRVYLSVNSTTVFSFVGASSSNSVTIGGLPPAAYGVSVTASNAAGESARSLASFAAGPYVIPSVPGGVNVLIQTQ